MTRPTPKLARDDWLEVALAAMLARGVTGVRVERLARALGVTKGSFYWHFKDRQDLLAQLLAYWCEELSQSVEREAERLSGSPEDRLLGLLDAIIRRNLNRYDRAVRAWATFDPIVAAAVRRVDEERLDCVRNLFLEMGFSKAEAELRSRFSYYYVVGEQTTGIDADAEARLRLLGARHRFLIRR